MACRLQVFKRDQMDGWANNCRFAVLDFGKSKDYPANFVCMLPVKVDQKKGKTVSVFEKLFGDNSINFAIRLLNDALKRESDVEVKTEIERRLQLLDPKQNTLIKCTYCKKKFQPRRIRKHRQNLCDDCLKARYGQRQH